MRITRRMFVKDSALCASGIALVPLIGTNSIDGESVEGAKAGSLEQLFHSPAKDAWPWVYWWGNNGNLSREAITADLEAMREVGICGALYMEVDQSIPKGPVRFLSPEWREMMQHASQEATRLGITLNMNNDGGWAGAGGPWITPELSMQIVVWSETTVEGSKSVSTMLSQPMKVQGYYNDIAVLAFPVPSGDSKRIADYSPKVTYGMDRNEFDYSKVIDGNPGTVTLLPLPPNNQPLCLNIDFPEPFTAQSASIALATGDLLMRFISGEIQVSDDGENYRTIRAMNVYWPNCSANFPKASSRHYRILIEPGARVRGAFSKGIPLGEIQLHEGPRIEDIPGKALYLRKGGYSVAQDSLSAQPEFPEDTVIHSGEILDLSKNTDSNGLLKWDAPAGKWTVLRIGCTTTGRTNEPAPPEATGLECDKLSKKAIEVQFEHLVGKLLQDQAAAGANAIKMTHVDSWETGSQNWTPDLREQFHNRRGYDPFPYLPILTGRAIESGERSERFLWDLRRTIADLLLENFADHLRELAHRHGLTLSIEAYGAGPLDELAYGGRADVPMGEFWVGHGSSEIFNVSTKGMASSAHTYGRPVIAAESFTAQPADGKWQDHPFSLKRLGDHAFTWGINRFVFNFFTMQYWPGRAPGMTTGPWGMHYDRTNTWWEQARTWNTYLARCQTLLQSGRFIADLAYLGSEGAPYSAPWAKDIIPAVPAGYDCDVLSPEVILNGATVREGRLILKSGMSYRLLVLQPGRSMTPALLKKIKELVQDGATVMGPRPASSPSLSDFPQCDAEVRQLAEELWAECDGSSVKENRFGNGRIVWGEALSDVLLKLGMPPDFDCYEAAVGEEIRFIHRNIDGDDFYFVASGLPEARRFLCTFRPSGKGMRPELWWPDSGRIEPISVFNESFDAVGIAPAGGESVSRISIPIDFDPYGSVFVVFRAGAEPRADHIVSVERDGAADYGLAPMLGYRFSTNSVKYSNDKGLILEAAEEARYDFVTAAGHSLKAEIPQLPAPISIQGPWRLEFPKGLGAPDHVTLDRLISWTDHPDTGVKYFSGTAAYRNRFTLGEGMLGPGRRFYLDLGRVCVIAEVALNRHNLGVLWKPPFIVDITDVLTANTNELEIRIVNLWPNRLIGDEHLPEDCEWAQPSTERYHRPRDWGAPLKRWPQWLLENKPSPTGRVTFITWKYWSKNDPLLESGLLGPVRIVTKAAVRLTDSGRAL